MNVQTDKNPLPTECEEVTATMLSQICLFCVAEISAEIGLLQYTANFSLWFLVIPLVPPEAIVSHFSVQPAPQFNMRMKK